MKYMKKNNKSAKISPKNLNKLNNTTTINNDIKGFIILSNYLPESLNALLTKVPETKEVTIEEDTVKMFPLYYTAINNKTIAFKILLNHGADIYRTLKINNKTTTTFDYLLNNDKFEMLECMFQNISTYKADYLQIASFVELNKTKNVIKIIDQYWHKIIFTDTKYQKLSFDDCLKFGTETDELIQNINKINSLLEGNSQANKKDIELLYNTVEELYSLKKLDFMNHGRCKEKTIFEKAINRDKCDLLTIILKAINAVGLDEDISLPTLIIATYFEIPNLLNCFVKKYPTEEQNLYICAQEEDNKNAIEYFKKREELRKIISQNKNQSPLTSFSMKEEKIERNQEKNKPKTNGLVKTNTFEEIYELLHPKEGNNTNLTAAQLCQEKDVRIEEYKIFASKKEKLLKSDIVEEEIHYWNIDNNTQYSSKDMICHEYAGKKWYFFTDFKLNKQEELAFKGDFVTRAKGQNGIKLLNNKSIIEIKTSAEERIYTDHCYENPKGAILVIFDKCGNHKKVASEAKEGKLEKVDVTDLVESKTRPSEEHHNSSSSSEEGNSDERPEFMGDNFLPEEN
jgi:hypothetical protein